MLTFPICHWSSKKGTIITGFTASIAVPTGQTIGAISWRFDSDHFGSIVYGSGTEVPPAQVFVTTAGGFDYYRITVTGISVSVPSGTVWLVLGSGVSAPPGSGVLWGDSGGPSLAYAGGIPLASSQSFNVQNAGGTFYDNGPDLLTTFQLINSGVGVTDSFIVP